MFSETWRFYKFLVLLSVLQPFFTCPGCSVKEDRDLCPCTLVLEFPREDAERLQDGVTVCMRGYSDVEGGFSLCDTISAGQPVSSGTPDGVFATGLDEYSGSGPDTVSGKWSYSYVVPKGDVDLAVAYSADGLAGELNSSGKWIEIDEGRPCPSIWTCCEKVSARADRVTVPVRLHKNFCRIDIQVRDVVGAEFPFKLRVRGNVNGYDLDGKPARGAFLCDAESAETEGSGFGTESEVPGSGTASESTGSGHGYAVTVPRQTDDSLILEIVTDDGVAKSFAIGNYVAASGYDWASADLKDICLEIDYARTVISFTIDKWTLSEQFEVVI